METKEKYDLLVGTIKELGSVAVAFSGGTDSTFLLSAAKQALGSGNVIAVTARSRSFPEREQKQAADFCKSEGIRQIICETDELQLPGFCSNPPDRCYICKKALFKRFLAVAGEYRMAAVAEGSNTDDLDDYRPGLAAVKELGVRSPLREAGLSKAEIRELSKRLGLMTWDKPSAACLASRFAYGEPITAEKLAMVEKGERLLEDLGFLRCRVRIHKTLARIEVPAEELERLMRREVREEIVRACREYGFSYVTVDLQGYRMGSMNEELPEEAHAAWKL